MKEFVKRRLKKLLHPLVSRLGYDNKASTKEKSLLEYFFQTLQETKFNPNHIVDVGANHGNWTRMALRYFPKSHYTLLEPQKWLETHINDILTTNSRVKFYPFGAGNSKGSFKFTLLDRDDSSNFLLSEEEAEQMGLRQIDVDVVTLNEFLPGLRLPNPDVIKIDAEGLDLQVLDGANDFFGKTELFIVEAGVGSKYIKNEIGIVIEYMKQRGYRLFEITDLNRPFSLQILWLVELVFMRENGFIHSKVSSLGID